MKPIFKVTLLIILLRLFTGCQNNSSKNDIKNAEVDSSKSSVNSIDTTSWGMIKGAIVYPTDAGVPSDYKIAAINLQTGETFTTSNTDLDFKNNIYQLKVKPGKYNVYSFLLRAPDDKAYYDEFVTCGLSINCHSHKKIDVVVKGGETSSKIDPADWYASK